MKNMIEYYYGFKNIDLNKKNDKYYFENNNKKYILFSCVRSDLELESINKILYDDKIYNKMIPNIFNQIVTYIDNKKYILVEKINNYEKEELTTDEITEKYKILNLKEYNSLLRIDWYDLWTKKVDYIIYQREHIKSKYQLANEYLDYYIYMAESAISYYKVTFDSMKTNNRNQYFLSHKRINSILRKDYYNIDDLIIDYPVRSLCEYLKYLFYNNKINDKILNNIFANVNYDEFLYRLFFSRMIFPSSFFDVYEKVVNDNLDEKELISIIKRIDEYEVFLKKIYYLINKKTKIPQIDWLS